MHELSIAQHIVDIVEEAVRPEPGAQVARVVVRIGRMVAVFPESLSFCYGAITDGTALSGSALVVEEVPVRVLCRTCGETTELESFALRCGGCGGVDLKVTSGDEMLVSHIEVEQ